MIFFLILAHFAHFCSFLQMTGHFHHGGGPPGAGMSQTSCPCPRGFAHSFPRGMILRRTSSLGWFFIILPTLMLEHLWTCYCGSRSPISLIRHERYVLHFFTFPALILYFPCISCYVCLLLVLNTFACHTSAHFSTQLVLYA